MQIKDEGALTFPGKLKSDPTKRSRNKYCRFHRDHGHDTADCYDLKQQIIAFIAELGVSYNDGFDDALRQAKALYQKLDFSSVNISVPEPMSVQPEQSDDINKLFGEEVPVPIAPVVLTVEGEGACQAKDSVVPDALNFFYRYYFVQVF